MFSNKSTLALFIIGSFGIVANVFADNTRTKDFQRVERSMLLPRQRASYSSSSSSSSQTEVSQFLSTWQGLSDSFSQCQSVFSQRSSINVAYQSFQSLYSSYQSAVNQYNSCASCAQFLSQSSYSSQIQTSVVEMYRSFQSIVSTGRQYYIQSWETQFASTSQSLSEFRSFSQTVCQSAGIDLVGILGNVGLDINLGGLLEGVINGALGGVVNGALGGALNGVLGGATSTLLGGSGGKSNGPLGNLLG